MYRYYNSSLSDLQRMAENKFNIQGHVFFPYSGVLYNILYTLFCDQFWYYTHVNCKSSVTAFGLMENMRAFTLNPKLYEMRNRGN